MQSEVKKIWDEQKCMKKRWLWKNGCFRLKMAERLRCGGRKGEDIRMGCAAGEDERKRESGQFASIA